jgi:hypothetical protein
MWRNFLPHLATRTLGGGQGDPGIFIWWLNWVPYAITHGLNPLRTNYLDAPGGVNAMWNTSVPALGVVFVPVTLAFGPIAAFNVAGILGPPLSVWAAWWWLRRHVHDVAAAIGGLVFGFSPFVIAHSHAGHLQFTWLVMLPIILMLVEDLLWRSPRPIWPRAPLLGLAVAVQLSIGAETLLILAIGCLLFVVLLAASRPRGVWPRLRILFRPRRSRSASRSCCVHGRCSSSSAMIVRSANRCSPSDRPAVTSPCWCRRPHASRSTPVAGPEAPSHQSRTACTSAGR